MKKSQWTVVSKDIKEILSSVQTLLPMIILPAILAVVLPLVLVLGMKGEMKVNGIDTLIKLLGSRMQGLDNRQMMFELAMNYFFPVFFLLIPILVSSIISASSFVGEKERKTMESLLYTPISIRELFVAKVLGAAIPAITVTVESAFLFGIVMNIGGWLYFGSMVFPNLKWILLIFWVSPSVSVLGIAFIVLVSAKANTFQEAQQMSALIIIPVLLLLVGQATGVFLLNELILFTVGLVVFGIDYFLIRNATKKFVAEKLVAGT